MTDQVLWALRPDDRRWPALDRDVEIDVTIVGGGIVGLSAAHFLANTGRSRERSPASPAPAATGASQRKQVPCPAP